MTALGEAEARLAALGQEPVPLPLERLAPVVEGAFEGLSRRDWVVPGPRERVGAVLRGCPVERLVRGDGARPYKVAPATVNPGARALHAVGLALASGEPVLCFLGLASAAAGAFHEAINTAGLTGAPVIFLVTTQPLGPDAPVGRQLAGTPAALGAAAGLDAVSVPGTVDAVREAVSAARAAGRPTVIEVNLES